MNNKQSRCRLVYMVVVSRGHLLRRPRALTDQSVEPRPFHQCVDSCTGERRIRKVTENLYSGGVGQ